MRILMMLTAAPGNRPSRSLGIEDVVEPYYLLQDSGTEVVVSSSLGGGPPIREARKNQPARAKAALQRFRGDRRARDAISDTLAFAQVFPEDFDGGIWIGALEDRARDNAVPARGLVTALLAAGKPTAVVPAELLAALGPLEGPLIIGGGAGSSLGAAKALLAALNWPRAPAT